VHKYVYGYIYKVNRDIYNLNRDICNVNMVIDNINKDIRSPSDIDEQ